MYRAQRIPVVNNHKYIWAFHIILGNWNGDGLDDTKSKSELISCLPMFGWHKAPGNKEGQAHQSSDMDELLHSTESYVV